MRITEKETHYGYKVLVTELSKEQLQIISKSLALHVEEIEVKETRKEIEKILGTLQSKGIWGEAKFFKGEE